MGCRARGCVRDNARHNALIITKQKHAERNKYAREITTLESVHDAAHARYARSFGDDAYIRALPVRPWMEPVRPDMMAPMQRSAREGRRGAIGGISMASLSGRAGGVE